VGGDWRAIPLGVAGLIAAAVSAQALTVIGPPFYPPVLSAISATGSAYATDGEGVDERTTEGAELPLFEYVYFDQQAGITEPGGVVVTGYENARASASINDFAEEYNFLISATAFNDNPYGLTLGGAQASATLTFQVEVGPLSTIGFPIQIPEVPVDLVGKTSGNGNANFEISATDPKGNLVYDTGLSQAGNSINETLYLTVGQAYTVTTQGSVYVAGNGTANLAIDPFLEIDPNFAFAQDLALYFSPGLFPAAVPEPPTASLLGAPLAAMLWWRWRRKPLRLNVGGKTAVIAAQI
jgi:hypothetical protein